MEISASTLSQHRKPNNTVDRSTGYTQRNIRVLALVTWSIELPPWVCNEPLARAKSLWKAHLGFFFPPLEIASSNPFCLAI
jgi:hypothetical protein